MAQERRHASAEVEDEVPPTPTPRTPHVPDSDIPEMPGDELPALREDEVVRPPEPSPLPVEPLAEDDDAGQATTDQLSS